MTDRQFRLVEGQEAREGAHDVAGQVSRTFDPARLTQARHLAELTKRSLAAEVGVSAAAVGQWEAGVAPPRSDHVRRLAEVLEVPVGFFASGRRYQRLDTADAHFRSLRSTPAALRAKAIAFTEQVWELTYALERRVRLPDVDLPGFTGGEVEPEGYAGDPRAAAQYLRKHWGLGSGRIPRLVRTMERHGIVVVGPIPFAGDNAKTAKVDAFSTSRLPRPVVVVSPDRADDVFRHRFTVAHELGHLMLHGDASPGDLAKEREADRFAAEFLTPTDSITPELPARLNIPQLEQVARAWGVSIDSLIYRCHELGRISESAYRRAFQRLNQHRKLGLLPKEPIAGYPGEVPVMLSQAYDVAEENGLTLAALAHELQLPLARVRFLLGQPDLRPALTIV